MTRDQALELRLQLEGEDADPEELDRLTQQLLEDLREHSVESVERVRDETAPVGTKAVQPYATAIAIGVLPKLLPTLIDFLNGWLERRKSKSVWFQGTLNGHPIDFRGPLPDLEKVIRTLTRSTQRAAGKP